MNQAIKYLNLEHFSHDNTPGFSERELQMHNNLFRDWLIACKMHLIHDTKAPFFYKEYKKKYFNEAMI